MTRARKRVIVSLAMIVLGAVTVVAPDALHVPHEIRGLPAMALFVAGGLGLLGRNVFRGGPLDEERDRLEAVPPADLLQIDRLMAQPGQDPGRRWLPLDFATFPQRCVGCRRPSDGFSAMGVRRGLNLPFLHVESRRSIDVPTCARCRSRRRAVLMLSYLVPALPFASLFAVDRQPSERAAILTLVTTAVVAIVVTNLGEAWIDRAILGIVGLRLERGGRSAWFQFRDPRLADEVAELTRLRIGQHLATPHAD